MTLPGLRYNKNLYANRSVAVQGIDRPNTQRLTAAISLVPQGVRSVLDVGCGTGYLQAASEGRFQVIGCDVDRSLLRNSGGPRVEAMSERLPFADGSFDLVAALELFEHLDDTCLGATCNEIVRVSRRYVLISVPNQEQIERLFWRCGSCGEVFHIYGHVRSFDTKSLCETFPQARPVTFHLIPNRVRRFHPALLRLRQKGFHTYTYDRNAVCPRCGVRGFKRSARQLVLQKLFGLANRCLPGTMGDEGWIVGLFRKDSEVLG